MPRNAFCIHCHCQSWLPPSWASEPKPHLAVLTTYIIQLIDLVETKHHRRREEVAHHERMDKGATNNRYNPCFSPFAPSVSFTVNVSFTVRCFCRPLQAAHPSPLKNVELLLRILRDITVPYPGDDDDPTGFQRELRYPLGVPSDTSVPTCTQ